MYSYVFVCLTIFQLTTGSSTGTTQSVVADAFVRDKIVRKVVVVPPNALVSVNYSGKYIFLGTTVQPLQTLIKPHVSYEVNDGDLYTLLFFGPDLPPSFVTPLTQLIHWGVCNIPGTDISKGSTIASYFPPTPYPGGFPYIFLLFKQKGLLDTSEIPNLSPILSRPGFSYTKFAEKYNLGDPIAGNFMHETYLQIIPSVLQSLYNIIARARRNSSG